LAATPSDLDTLTQRKLAPLLDMPHSPREPPGLHAVCNQLLSDLATLLSGEMYGGTRDPVSH